MFKEPSGEQYCLRRISGLICLVAGVVVILTKVGYFMFTGVAIPFDGRGQFLVGTGAALLGLTSFDNLLNKGVSNGKQTNGTNIEESAG